MRFLSQILVATCIFLVLTGEALMAATGISVRSGEHLKFSRLVFGIGARYKWSFNKFGDKYILTFKPAPDSMDMAGIFRFIPKKRILSVKNSPVNRADVILAIADGQSASAVEIAGGKLVIDVRDKTFPQARGPDSFGRKARISASSTMQNHGAAPFAQVAMLKPPVPRPEQRLLSQIPQQSAKTRRHMFPQGRPAVVTPEFPDIRLLEAQQNLVEQLGRAMTEGLVQPAIPARNRKAPGGYALLEMSSPGILMKTPGMGGDVKQFNIDATTVFEQDKRAGRGGLIRSRTPRNCLDDRIFNLGAWYGDKSGPGEMAVLRRTLLKEFDRADKRVLKKLVKFYIVEGFGTEAKNLLKSYPGVLAQQQVLAELAELLETGKVFRGHKLASQIRCPGASAMWGLLARGSVPIGEKPDGRKIAKQISRMPADLRRRIGTLLMSLLLDAKYPDLAQKIAMLIERSPGKKGDEFRFQMARLDFANGYNEKAIDSLFNISRTDTASTGKALALLPQTLMRLNRNIPDTLLKDVAAKAFELRYSDLGQRLRRIDILSRAYLQRQYSAFTILAHALKLGTIPAKITGEIASRIFVSFNLKQPMDSQIVKTYFRYKRFLTPDSQMDPARRHMAEGMLLANLPSIAMQIIAPLKVRMTDRDKVLEAHILFELGQPGVALARLGKLETNSANILRRKIFAETGKYDRAIAVPVSGVDSSNPLIQDLAWRAGRWDLVAQSPKASRRKAAQYVEGAVDSSVSDPGHNAAAPQGRITLGKLRADIKASRQSRREIETLLKDHPPP